MQKWLSSVRAWVKSEIHLVRNARSFSDFLRLSVRLAFLLFLVFFKWIIPLIVVVIVRVVSN
jgi:hypothetical protein